MVPQGMARARFAAALLALAAGAAHAQPADPYAPTSDPVLNEQVAQSLVQRAQELFDAKQYAELAKIKASDPTPKS